MEAWGMVRGDILAGETHQRAPGIARVVGATRGLRTPERERCRQEHTPDDFTTSVSVPSTHSELLPYLLSCCI